MSLTLTCGSLSVSNLAITGFCLTFSLFYSYFDKYSSVTFDTRGRVCYSHRFCFPSRKKDKNGDKRGESAKELFTVYWLAVLIIGTLLCLSIVWCNLAVSRALSRLSRRAGALRRISRASSRAKPLLTVAGPPNRSQVVATAEERAFARLMAVLSISFVICWMPHMVSSNPQSATVRWKTTQWIVTHEIISYLAR